MQQYAWKYVTYVLSGNFKMAFYAGKLWDKQIKKICHMLQLHVCQNCQA